MPFRWPFFCSAHAAGPACGGAGRAGEARNLAMDEAAMQGYVGVVQVLGLWVGYMRTL